MPSYSTPGSNASMEAWYPLSGLWFSKIWAQTMRQISRRCADMNITCDWRSSVNTGAPVQYPADDFMLGCTGFTREAGEIYLNKMLDYLGQAVEAEKIVACQWVFFAPSVNIPWATGEDGLRPMTWVGASVEADIRDPFWPWKFVMEGIRTIVDALNRLKTIESIPHPGTLTVTLDSEVWADAYTYTGSDNVIVAESTVDYPYHPSITEGYRIEREAAGKMPVPTGGTTISSPSSLEIQCQTRVTRLVDGPGGEEWRYKYPDSPVPGFSGPITDDLVKWLVVRKVTRTWTVGYSPSAWSAYKATYGVTDTMPIPVRVTGGRQSGPVGLPTDTEPLIRPDLKLKLQVGSTVLVDTTASHGPDATINVDVTVDMLGGSFTMVETLEYDEDQMEDVALFVDDARSVAGYEMTWGTDWAGVNFVGYDGSDIDYVNPASVSCNDDTWTFTPASETLDACDLGL